MTSIDPIPGPAGDICITALGMATALAPSLVDSCAAFRAGLTRTSEISTVIPDEDAALAEEPIAACRAAYLAEGYCSGAKAVLLGRIALSDLLKRRPLTDRHQERTGIVLHLSDCFLLDAVSGSPEDQDEENALPSALWQAECASLIPRMLSGIVRIPTENRHLSFGEHAGFAGALQIAADMLASGQLDRCLVGAADSLLDPEFLLAGAVSGLVKTSVNPTGFVPGEAAAFILVEKASEARHQGARPLASFLCGPLVRGAFDRFSEEPPDGAVLARAIRDLLARQPRHSDVALVIGDLNGDECRARNWGNALVRLRNSHGLADAPMWIPALGFGETGSASGAVGLCLAARAIERGHLGRGAALTWLSDESGAGAAIMIMSEHEA
jgi:3-oxoacyl-[acyl-carrier-protein] synthase I